MLENVHAAPGAFARIHSMKQGEAEYRTWAKSRGSDNSGENSSAQ
jgi:hypothetical protein